MSWKVTIYLDHLTQHASKFLLGLANRPLFIIRTDIIDNNGLLHFGKRHTPGANYPQFLSSEGFGDDPTRVIARQVRIATLLGAKLHLLGECP